MTDVLHVHVSSTVDELAEERAAVSRAVRRLHLATGDLAGAHVVVGVYWREDAAALHDDYAASGDRPRLIYVKAATDRSPGLAALLDRIRADDLASYRPFSSAAELEELVADDLAVLLSEGFETAHQPAAEVPDALGAGLPAPVTALVGRADEIAQITDLLTKARLVTLTGPGGVGKSRVAIEVARRVRVPDGVTFVSLGGIRDAGLVVGAVATALRIREAPDRTPFEAVIDALRERQALLVLDNCEHVLAAGPRISELLAACPGLRVLATSRSVLRLRGEHDVEIDPLPEDEAVRLFVDRATQVNAGLRLTPDEADAIAEVCRRLDGLPLAIELAAARTRMLTPAALLARLTSRLALLTNGPRDLPERQQTLRAALDWDYDLLDGEERALFRRLAVCEGGCGFATAEALASAGGGLGLDVTEGLDSLVAKSLLHRDHTDGEPRFAMLQTLREYALERLAESGEQDVAERAHADRFADLVREGDMQSIDKDRMNVRAALGYFARTGDVVREVEMCALLAPYWLARAAFAEATQAVESALTHSAGTTVPKRVRVLIASAAMARNRGDRDLAIARVDEATREAEATDDRPGLARAWRERGAVEYDDGDVPAAAAATQRAYEVSVETGDDDLVARSLNNLAVFAYIQGDYDTARQRYAESLPPFARAGDTVGIARALMNLGRLHLATGDIDRGAALSTRALAMWCALGDEWDAADSLDDVAVVLLHRGDAERAALVYSASAALRDRIGARLPQSELAEYEHRAARIAEALGPDAYAAARERGAALDFTAAVRTALGELPDGDVLDLTGVEAFVSSDSGPGRG